MEHVKHRLLGHWGASPALSFVWTHLNRAHQARRSRRRLRRRPRPRRAGRARPRLPRRDLLRGLPGQEPRTRKGCGSSSSSSRSPATSAATCTPETPGSIHEGGELGYSLSHAFGAAFDNPDLIVACVVGDGEAETGPLATAWHSNKFLNPVRDGAVLPILNLNGYKIANPTILARIPHEELESLFAGYGYTPYFVEGDDHARMHQAMAATLEPGDRRDPHAYRRRRARPGRRSARAGR